MSEKILNHKIYDVIKYPYITEKSTNLSEYSKIIFLVSTNSSKSTIKESVEKIFKVSVKSVNTINKKGKRKTFKGRQGIQSDFKKAIITLMPGQNIDFTVGI